MRLNSQYIRTQLMVQNILKRNAADTTLKNCEEGQQSSRKSIERKFE